MLAGSTYYYSILLVIDEVYMLSTLCLGSLIGSHILVQHLPEPVPAVLVAIDSVGATLTLNCVHCQG